MADTQSPHTGEQCICPHNYPMTEDRHAINCPASVNYAAYLEHSKPAHTGEQGEQPSANPVKRRMMIPRNLEKYPGAAYEVADDGFRLWIGI